MTGIAAGFFSLTSVADERDEADYLRWHLLDHLPEQFAIPEIRLGTRWRADDECMGLRLAQRDDLAPARHVMGYLVAEPVEAALTEFVQLGGRLRDAGRYPLPATPHLLGAFSVTGRWAAPSATVDAAVVPFRAHRGVYLVLEAPSGEPGDADRWGAWHDHQHVPALLGTDGVAGVWTFAASERLGTDERQGERFGMPAWDPKGLQVTVVYLDGEVAETADRLRPLIEARGRRSEVVPVLAGPFRATVAYEAWPAGS